MEKDSITISQVYKDFKGAISGIADSLKVGAEHVYDILIQQQYVNSTTNCIVYALAIAVLYFIWKISLKKSKQISDDNRYRDGQEVFILFPAGLLSIIFIMCFLLTINSTITGFLNPEYGAIMEIKSFIK